MCQVIEFWAYINYNATLLPQIRGQAFFVFWMVKKPINVPSSPKKVLFGGYTGTNPYGNWTCWQQQGFFSSLFRLIGKKIWGTMVYLDIQRTHMMWFFFRHVEWKVDVYNFINMYVTRMLVAYAIGVIRDWKQPIPSNSNYKCTSKICIGQSTCPPPKKKWGLIKGILIIGFP